MALNTKIYPFETVLKYRKVARKDILKHFFKKDKGAVLYFLNTGRDAKNIMRELKKHKFEQNGRSKMYNQTIPLSDWDTSAIAKRLELRYNTTRFYNHLYRELDKRYSYDMILRVFTRFRDTTGGKLWEEINELVNSR